MQNDIERKSSKMTGKRKLRKKEVNNGQISDSVGDSGNTTSAQ